MSSKKGMAIALSMVRAEYDELKQQNELLLKRILKLQEMVEILEEDRDYWKQSTNFWADHFDDVNGMLNSLSEEYEKLEVKYRIVKKMWLSQHMKSIK